MYAPGAQRGPRSYVRADGDDRQSYAHAICPRTDALGYSRAKHGGSAWRFVDDRLESTGQNIA